MPPLDAEEAGNIVQSLWSFKMGHLLILNKIMVLLVRKKGRVDDGRAAGSNSQRSCILAELCRKPKSGRTF